ncbi:hypothetical protein [Streptomyces sp. VRA16 Mangrove soil]|uniref:hypothetical protein n=1 Tax=Streptomyces sp. VRA16 Mangrove soil TaxID=2817434 RepID=UPI001A9EA6D1|nr:hypothetical protein [Streptomyces sp. VRA16 Mangrove soil]MBO1329793.1 hypothetical protein [Streptomyces sp. VRA16 Mangrove soil]
MNVFELLRLLQAAHEETAGRTDHLRGRIGQLTTARDDSSAKDSSNSPDAASTGNGLITH